MSTLHIWQSAGHTYRLSLTRLGEATIQRSIRGIGPWRTLYNSPHAVAEGMAEAICGRQWRQAPHVDRVSREE